MDEATDPSSPRFDWRRVRRSVGALTLAVVLMVVGGASSAANALPTVRVGVLKFGTVNWQLDVMQHHGFDAAAGVRVEVTPLASTNAVAVALQGGAVDVIVSDWIWVSRQRADGRNYSFSPYSLAVGSLLVQPDAGIVALPDLAGRRLGVAGGPVDKSWLLVRAYARSQGGDDPEDQAELAFGAPPLINRLMLAGDLDAAINYWHYSARLKTAGMQELISVQEILPALGIETAVPLLGWVFDQKWASAHQPALTAFLTAARAASRQLDQSNAEWERIRSLTKAEDDATLVALRDAYRVGIPQRFGEAERSAATDLFEVLAEQGGETLVGSSRSLSPGTFWADFEIEAWR